MQHSLNHPLIAFGLNPINTVVRPHHQGHINDTYFIEDSSNCYVLQRINGSIFTDIPALMHNLETITAHLKNYYQNSTRCTLTLQKTIDGHSFFKDEENHYWRLCDLIPNTQSIDNPKDAAMAYEGAFAFGDFVHGLTDLEPSTIHETIPNFMNLNIRDQHLSDAIKQDPHQRLKAIEEELSTMQALSETLIQDLKQVDDFPTHITHNDTKFNNLLFSKQQIALCVVDLDTVMPGSVIHDFSDLVRTAAHRCPEDSTDPSQAVIDPDLFEALYNGYCDGLQSTITPFEREAMLRFSHLMPVMLGLRFYTDYLLGDVYFTTTHDKHNLHRARVQVGLAKSLFKYIGETSKR